MFSPAKLVVAAAVLALAGGLASTGILTAPRDVGTPGGAPAAEADPEFVIVEGSGSFLGESVVNGRSEMSDPRVSGDWEISQEMVCQPGGGYTCTKWGQATLVEEGGTWEGEWAGFHEPVAPGLPSGQHSITFWLEGTGGYEGLNYIGTLTGDPNDTVVRGIIYEGPIPPTVRLGAVPE